MAATAAVANAAVAPPEWADSASLLETIRDLADVWNIDIAFDLEEYVDKLATITFQLEESGEKLNFFQMALLIQRAVCIYSKKVDSLTSLVYNALNKVVPRSEAGPTAGPTSEDPDDPGLEPFITLEDTLKEVDNISLPPPPPAGGAPRDTRAFTLASAPLSLMSRDGDARRDDGSTENKMHGCTLHASGALMLPHLHVPERVLASLPAPARHAMMRGSAGGSAAASGPELGAEAGAGGDGSEQGMDMATAEAETEGWEEEMLDSFRDVDPDPYAEPDPDPDPPSPGPPAAEDGDNGESGAYASPAGEPRSPSPRPPRSRPAAAAAPPAAPTFDPWAPLDPHCPSGAARRPFRLGKTWSAPKPWEGADEDEEGEGSSSKESVDDGGVGCKGDVLMELGLTLPSSPRDITTMLRTPLWPQFEGLHAAASKRRAAARKKQRQDAAKHGHVVDESLSHEEIADVEVEPPAGPGSASNEAGGAMGARQLEEEEEAAGLGLSGLLHQVRTYVCACTYISAFIRMRACIRMHTHARMHAQARIHIRVHITHARAPVGRQGVDDDDHDDGFGDGGDMEDEDEGRTRPLPAGRKSLSSYEELCRMHVEAMMEASASYEEDYELHKRVAEWTQRVEPLLKEQSCHAPYDLHEYANRLLASFDEENRSAARQKR